MGDLSSGVKRLGREADRSPPSSAVKCSYIITPAYALMMCIGTALRLPTFRYFSLSCCAVKPVSGFYCATNGSPRNVGNLSCFERMPVVYECRHHLCCCTVVTCSYSCTVVTCSYSCTVVTCSYSCTVVTCSYSCTVVTCSYSCTVVTCSYSCTVVTCSNGEQPLRSSSL
jgi:hypothetical protein